MEYLKTYQDQVGFFVVVVAVFFFFLKVDLLKCHLIHANGLKERNYMFTSANIRKKCNEFQ